MKKIIFLLLTTITLIFACKKLRLDPLLFNRNTDITAYNLDKYTGEVDFILDSTYTIADSLINIFTLKSKAATENETTEIFAIYIGNIKSINTDSVIYYLHGNKDHMDFYWQRAKLLANTISKNNYGVLMIDYRGYGLSKGTPSEIGMYADASAGLDWLKANGLTSDRLIAYGFSLGSAPTCEIMANTYSLKPFKFLLEAPFAGSAVMSQDGGGSSLSASYIADSKIDNAKKIKSITQPLCWIHGEDDAFLSIKTHGEVVYKNYAGTYKESHRIVGGEHSTVPQTMGFKNYSNTIGNFIRKK